MLVGCDNSDGSPVPPTLNQVRRRGNVNNWNIRVRNGSPPKLLERVQSDILVHGQREDAGSRTGAGLVAGSREGGCACREGSGDRGVTGNHSDAGVGGSRDRAGSKVRAGDV